LKKYRAIDLDDSRRGGVQAGEDGEQRRFSRARGADDRDRLGGVTARSMSRRMTRSESPLLTVLPMPPRPQACLLVVLMVAAPAASAADRSHPGARDSVSAAFGIPQARGWVALLAQRLKQERLD